MHVPVGREKERERRGGGGKRESGRGREGERKGEMGREKERATRNQRLTIVVFPIHSFHCQSKVGQLDACSLLLASEEKILWLDITMDDPV